MSASSFSQILLEKTTYQGKNAFIGNEAAMDSIAATYLRFKSCVSKSDQYKLELQLASVRIEKLNLQVDFLTADISNLTLQNLELKKQISIKGEIHENEILYYKKKAKGKFTSFLLGTGLGALILSLIMLL